jgi:hypothetical protein
LSAFLLLVPSISSAITLREYEQARGDPATQAKIFTEAYDTALSTTLVRLKATTFKDGKVKTPARIQSDSDQAQRIQQLGPHLTTTQMDALMNLVAQYAAAQPETELEAVITSYVLTESQTPFQRYERAHKDFKARMAAWHDAENVAQVELNVERLALDDRRKQLDTTNRSPEIPAERIEALLKDFRLVSVIEAYIAGVLSPIDAAGRAKGPEGIDADTRRAAIVVDIGKNYDTEEVGRRIYAAMKAGATVDPSEIFRGYVRDELAKREALSR